MLFPQLNRRLSPSGQPCLTKLVYGAADFVSWFDGHPDVPRTWPLEAEQVAVLGNGNVALDVARMLAKHADDLLTTDIPANVYEGLKASPVTDVHVFGRRGPASIKFTPIELRELGEVEDVDIVLSKQVGIDTQGAGVLIKILVGTKLQRIHKYRNHYKITALLRQLYQR